MHPSCRWHSKPQPNSLQVLGGTDTGGGVGEGDGNRVDGGGVGGGVGGGAGCGAFVGEG